MDIVFIGNSKISIYFLKEFIKYGFKISVFNKKNNKKKFVDDFVDLEDHFKSSKIKFFKYKNINSIKNINILKKIKPTYIFSLGSSDIIGKKILNIPKHGTIGFHPTKLPQNRGNHPIIWTILLGLRESATTFFYLSEKIDHGDIISQKSFKIPHNSDAKKLLKIITRNSLDQLKKILIKIKSNSKLQIKKRNNSIKFSNYLRKRNYKDGIINWNMSFDIICRHVRALSDPYSGAEFVFKKKRFKIYNIKKNKKNFKHKPGKILKVNNKSFDIACYDYEMRVLSYYPIINLKKIYYL